MTYTVEQIRQMQAGPELDAAAARILGHKTYEDFPVHAIHWWPTPTSFKVWRPSISLPEAIEVEELFNQDADVRGQYMISLMSLLDIQPHVQLSLDDLYLIAHASPLDRCKAALLALKGETGHIRDGGEV